MPALKETRAGQPQASHVFRRVSLSHVLVVGQIAISLLMLVAAGLFVRTLANLRIDRARVQSRERAAVPVGRPQGRAQGPGDRHVLRRSAQAIRRDSGGAQREPLAKIR